MAVPPFALYLFDVDGTLLDSAPDITAAVREVLQGEPIVRPASDEYLRGFIGHHLRATFLDLLPAAPEEKISELIATYRRIYPARNHRLTRVYPGIEEMLRALPGRKSTATTKATETTRTVLTQFGLLQYFDHIQGTDDFPAKPDPSVILASLRHFNARPEDCLMIGDAGPDMEAGRRAGVRTCAVTWGYGDRKSIEYYNPDYTINSPFELLL